MEAFPNLPNIVSKPDETNHVRVKVGEVFLDQDDTCGCAFTDSNDPDTSYTLIKADDCSAQFPGQVEADLTITDAEYDQISTHRVRVSRHLREARTLTWENLDERHTMRTMYKVGAIVSAAAIGVMTLYKIRSRRSYE